MDALRRRPQPPGGDRPAATVAAAVGALLDLLQRPRHPFLGRDQLLDHAYIGEAADRLGGAVAEPVHGSAPDIAGRGVANPCGAIWSAALMLADLGEAAAAERVMGALERVCLDGPRSRDIGGSASTAEVGDAVVRIVAAGAAD